MAQDLRRDDPARVFDQHEEMADAVRTGRAREAAHVADEGDAAGSVTFPDASLCLLPRRFVLAVGERGEQSAKFVDCCPGFMELPLFSH